MQKRTKYTAEFREEAVKLALSSELSSAMISCILSTIHLVISVD
jgi:transposase-like protein